MKARLRALAAPAAWAALALLPVAASRAMPADQVYARAAPSVWMVLATNGAGTVFSLGSAVVIATDTLVTNCHVLKGASGVRVRREARELPAQLQYPDVARDLCQLHAPGLLAPAVRIAPLAGVAVGQKVYAIGDPRGLEATLSDGLVSSLRRDAQGSVQFIQTSAPLSPGSSGGGLFDEDGLLVGITSQGIATGIAQNLNFARPAEYIAQVPARGRANLSAWRASRPPGPPGTDAAALADAAAVAPKPAPAPVAVATPVPPPAPGPAWVALPAAPAAAAPAPVAPAVPAPVAWAPAVVVPAPPAPPVRRLAEAPDVQADSLARFAGRTPDMQAAYEEFLGKGLPRAFAVSEDGHFAVAYGARASGGGYAADVPARAMEYCQLGGGQGCTLFAVDRKVVYGGP